jgi:hypothetical protein
MHTEIKRKLNLRNACYHLVKGLLSFCLLSRNVKLKRYIRRYKFPERVVAKEPHAINTSEKPAEQTVNKINTVIQNHGKKLSQS